MDLAEQKFRTEINKVFQQAGEKFVETNGSIVALAVFVSSLPGAGEVDLSNVAAVAEEFVPHGAHGIPHRRGIRQAIDCLAAIRKSES